ncbi:MAG TPA: hypothetical protein VKK79_26370 [Candidatus Lokiarchaeia archaeon]|nr:hypothetical protein [Candidatus Lokiarchaeia archaeon]
MTSVSVDKEFLESLIDFKQRHLSELIQEILAKWKYETSTAFIEDARNGTLAEAEMDAIALRQLLKDRDDLEYFMQE